MLFDRYGRPFQKLRYVVNDECNYNCVFCHFEGQLRRQGSYLTAEDYGFVSSFFKSLGVADFKITGGEPLLRRDIDLIVANVAKTGAYVTVTTNGYLLRGWVDRLRKAGVARLNVSVHTTDPEKYAKITNTSPAVFREVMRGLAEARDRGLALKLNVVVLRDINTDRQSVKELVKLAARLGASLQFIELMPTGSGTKIFDNLYEPIESIVEIITQLGGRPIGVRRELHNRPLYLVGGVVVELIKNFNNSHFCAGCTTMRLTSDGKLKTCIYADDAVDLLPYIKSRDVEGLLYSVRLALAKRQPKFKFYSSS